jgi:trimethylamine:corrinoid methyltransferase-like protein
VLALLGILLALTMARSGPMAAVEVTLATVETQSIAPALFGIGVAEAWRSGSRKYLDGLSRSIDLQLDQWQLSAAEKEVAFFLLKGLSLK